LQFVSPWVADRLLMTATLLGFAVSLVWLRWKVRGGEAMLGSCLLAALVSINYLWLMGFTSFLLGSCLFPITLGVWWSGRDRPGLVRPAAIMVLLLFGYFCHLVSLGLTVLGLVVLALAAPSQAATDSPAIRRLGRLGRTAISFLPLIPLGFLYVQMSRRGGPMHPSWENLADPFSSSAWASRLTWVDPLTVAMKDVLPFTGRVRGIFAVFAPIVWLSLAGLCWWAARLTAGSRRDMAADQPALKLQSERLRHEDREGRRDQGIWLALAALLMLVGLIGPDSLGEGHGEYLPQRLVLLGLAALVPAFDVKLTNVWGRLAAACLFLALVLQTLILWDYALYSQRTAGQIIQSRDLIGNGKRVGTLLVQIAGRFRVNSLLHADNWLGVGTGNIVWNNYETRHYYFPVQFRAGIERPDSTDLEWLAIHDDPREAQARAMLWKALLAKHSRSIDVVVVWRENPAFAAITEEWFELASRFGDVSIYKRRGGSGGDPTATQPATVSLSSASSARRDKPRQAPARSLWDGHVREQPQR
jgi:hypothetical protein